MILLSWDGLAIRHRREKTSTARVTHRPLLGSLDRPEATAAPEIEDVLGGLVETRHRHSFADLAEEHAVPVISAECKKRKVRPERG